MHFPVRRQNGVTLLEMIVVITILLIMMGAAVPVLKVSVPPAAGSGTAARPWEMRSAIDRYKDAADKNAFQQKLGSEGYPPDMDTLVNGVEVAGGKKLPLFAPDSRRSHDWEHGLGPALHAGRSQSDSWGGQNVFDVYTKSTGVGLDGTKYKDW